MSSLNLQLINDLYNSKEMAYRGFDMSKKSFNLVYSSKPAQANSSFNFFKNLEKMNEIILHFKLTDVINDFNAADEREIGRGASYAVFPELATMCQNYQQITLDAFRNSLKTRGVIDVAFQNKIMSLVLQNKAGLHYALGNILNGLLMENNHTFLMQSNYDLQLNVKDKDHIQLVFTGKWRHLTNEDGSPDLSATAIVNITPNKVCVDSFQVTQLSDTTETKDAFRFLEANQATLLEKIFIFLKKLFGMNADTELENVKKDDVPWQLNKNTYNTLYNNENTYEEESPENEESSQLNI